jgi:hypothetical protein
LSQIDEFLTSTAFQSLDPSHITVFHLIYVLGQIFVSFHIYTFHSIYVPDFKIAHFSKTIFHLIVTHSSISHFISFSDNLFKKYSLAVKISQGYVISIISFSTVNGLKGKFTVYKFIASVNSYSHLSDFSI